MHCSPQIALIELIRAFVPIEATFKIEMAKIDVTVQKNLPDALALISRNTKALLLRKSQRRVRRSDSDDGWLVQFGSLTKQRFSAFADAHRLVLQQVRI